MCGDYRMVQREAKRLYMIDYRARKKAEKAKQAKLVLGKKSI